jgi:hypothetical protein
MRARDVMLFIVANGFSVTAAATVWGYVTLNHLDDNPAIYASLPMLLPYFDHLAIALFLGMHVTAGMLLRRAGMWRGLVGTLFAWIIAMPVLLYLKPQVAYAAMPHPGLAYWAVVVPASTEIRPELWHALRALPAHASAEKIIESLGAPSRVEGEDWRYLWNSDGGFRIVVRVREGRLIEKEVSFYFD